MAQLQLLIELRCVQCDSVLVVNGIHTDKDGCFAYIEPCEECAAEQSVHLTGGSRVVGESNSENYVRWQNGDLPEEPASR